MQNFRPKKNRRQRSRSRSAKPQHQSPAAGERLQKVLAAAGLASRRECEEWILQGRVEVDGQTVTELGTRVLPSQNIRVDGAALARTKREYFLVNKPVNVLCTNFDPSGRPRVIDLLPAKERLFTVGRLDRSSEGLILVTNDGELAHRLMHPRFEVEKTYLVRVAGLPSNEVLDKLRRGIHLAEGFARVAALFVRRRHRLCTDLEIVLKEGKNREIRRILARIGHKVLKLRRIAFGPIRLADLPTGSFRRLSSDEVNQLRSASEQAARRKRRMSSSAEGPNVGTNEGRTTSEHRATTDRRASVPEYVAPAVAPDKSRLANLSDWESELLKGDEFSTGGTPEPERTSHDNDFDDYEADDLTPESEFQFDSESDSDSDSEFNFDSDSDSDSEIRGPSSYRGSVIGDDVSTDVDSSSPRRRPKKERPSNKSARPFRASGGGSPRASREPGGKAKNRSRRKPGQRPMGSGKRPNRKFRRDRG